VTRKTVEAASAASGRGIRRIVQRPSNRSVVRNRIDEESGAVNLVRSPSWPGEIEIPTSLAKSNLNQIANTL
jgi:hypothetical protein